MTAAERRRQWLEDKRCAHCGSREKLEVDHIDPKTKVSHEFWGWPEEERLLELAKCQALCEECHKKKSAQERDHTMAKRNPRTAQEKEKNRPTQVAFRLSSEDFKLLDNIRKHLEEANPGLKFSRADAVRSAITRYAAKIDEEEA
jgi:multidrug efflux pump subunit AcrB